MMTGIKPAAITAAKWIGAGVSGAIMIASTSAWSSTGLSFS